MRILQINTEKTWRGGERQTLYTLEGLYARPETRGSALLCLAGRPLAAKARSLGLPLIEVAGPLQALRFLSLHGQAFDVLHAQAAKAQSLAVLTKPLHRTPLVYTRRVDFRPKGLSARIKYRLTDRTVAISEAIRDILAEVGIGNVPVIPSAARLDPVSDQDSQAALAGLGLSTGCHVLGTVAAFVDHKDPLTMVRAVAGLSRLRQDFVFLHFGDGPLMGQAKDLAVSLGLDDTYRFMGFRDDFLPFLTRFACFAMSSREEGLGSTVLDAFLRDVPVVSTQAGGLKELVTGRGQVCPVGAADCLAQAMHKVLAGDDEVRTMARAAKEHALARHSVQAMTQAYLDIYAELTRANTRN